MDSFVGVGAAASIVTLLALLYDIIHRLKECHNRAITMRRRMDPLLACTFALRDTVNTVRTTEHLVIPSAIENLIRQCLETIEEVDHAAPDFIPFEDDNILRRLRKMLRILRRQEWVEEKEKNVNSYTVQVTAWLISQRVASAMSALGVLLLHWLFRKRPSISPWNGCNFDRVLRGGLAALQGVSELSRARRVHQVSAVYGKMEQKAPLTINWDSNVSNQPPKVHELSWVDPQFRTAGTELALSPIVSDVLRLCQLSQSLWGMHRSFNERHEPSSTTEIRHSLDKLRRDLDNIHERHGLSSTTGIRHSLDKHQRFSEKDQVWLSAWPGTGNFTITRTLARWHLPQKRLGPSFFFSRGGSDVGNASKFFTDIAFQLTKRSPALKYRIIEAINELRDIGTLREEWELLILQPPTLPGTDLRQQPLLPMRPVQIEVYREQPTNPFWILDRTPQYIQPGASSYWNYLTHKGYKIFETIHGLCESPHLKWNGSCFVILTINHKTLPSNQCRSH